MVTINDYAGYWDRYAAGVATDAPEESLKYAFGWTQYEGHGPGDELLGEPATALELGSGRGNAVAALATKGIDATGIDISSVQCEQAKRRWGHLSGAGYVCGDVVDHLIDTDRRWDAIYSIWGAVWFTDPERLLPLTRDHLTPGGKLAFSHAPAVPRSYGAQGFYAAGFTGRQVWAYRWAYEPEGWTEILRRHGFVDICARVEPAPDPDHIGTLIVEARRS
ncbi:class I SAM-dependent methyltransferase [Actinoallomurus sp. NPDC050550]|uniref:class I SAM-dependent DNA methyltransferase n=1 Tax=Actinoallomurus sp. NPDC050550 TaxID=3154937 RepID=UPI0033E11E05